MADDTTTSITGGQDPVYTESLTRTLGRPPRRLYFYFQLTAFVVTIGMCWVSNRYHEQIEKMESSDLQRFAAVAAKVGSLLTTPVGLACAIFVVVGLGLLAVRGALDGFLKLLIWLNVLWLLGFVVFSTMGLWLPILKARQAAGP
ncbi:MAG TPA: hypothetical protein VM222_02645 [Planctomycetota bacterium]|nr:hypothetical protein [Planctomycetota bacterium]